jgi:hypothetical protein
MDRTHQKKLVEALIAESKNGSLEWEPMSGQRSFTVPLRKGSVAIRHCSYEEEDWYEISILNDQGVEVETLTNSKLDEDEGWTRKWYEILQQLFDLARRKALKSDEVLSDILEELKERHTK